MAEGETREDPGQQSICYVETGMHDGRRAFDRVLAWRKICLARIRFLRLHSGQFLEACDSSSTHLAAEDRLSMEVPKSPIE